MVSTSPLKAAVEKFVAKVGKPARTNVPENHNSINPEILRKIQELQQQVERVKVLTAVKVVHPESTLQIQEIIEN